MAHPAPERNQRDAGRNGCQPDPVLHEWPLSLVRCIGSQPVRVNPRQILVITAALLDQRILDQSGGTGISSKRTSQRWLKSSGLTTL